MILVSQFTLLITTPSDPILVLGLDTPARDMGTYVDAHGEYAFN